MNGCTKEETRREVDLKFSAQWQKHLETTERRRRYDNNKNLNTRGTPVVAMCKITIRNCHRTKN